MNKELKLLFETGKSRKYKLEESVCRRFTDLVNRLVHAPDMYGLWGHKAMNFEKMQGHEKRFSARIDIRHRLEMEIDWENPEKTIGVIGIVELSRHYGGK